MVTYGSNDLPGVKIGVDSSSIGVVDDNCGVEIWGHDIAFEGDDILCTTCNMEESVPELIKLSSDRREVLYRAYLFAKFKKVDCTSDSAVVAASPGDLLKTRTTRNPSTSNKHYSNGDKISLDGRTYYYEMDGYWINDNGDLETVESIMSEHGVPAADKFADEVVSQVGDTLKTKTSVGAGSKKIPGVVDHIDNKITVGGVSTNTSNNTSDELDGSDDNSDDNDNDDNDSLRTKFARALGRGDTTLR